MEATITNTPTINRQVNSSRKLQSVYVKRNIPITNTAVIAKKIGVPHRQVINAFNRLLDDHLEINQGGNNIHPFRPFCLEVELKIRGQIVQGYEVNEPLFFLLINRFTTKKAREIQFSLMEEFYQMKQQILQAKVNIDNQLFQQFRLNGKQTRRNLTDAIQDFSEYAKEQGSQGYPYFYSTVTKWIYKALDMSAPDSHKIRDALSSEDVKALDDLEYEVAELIVNGIDSWRHYKTIKSDIRGLLNGKTKE